MNVISIGNLSNIVLKVLESHDKPLPVIVSGP